MAKRVIEARARITAEDQASGVFAKVARRLGILQTQSQRIGNAYVAASLRRAALPAAAMAVGAVAAQRNFAMYDRQITHLANTAEASAEQVAMVRREVNDTAKLVAEKPEAVLAATNAYVTAGENLTTAAKATRETAVTAKAFGADIEETARAGTAVIQNMGIQVENLGRAFDIMGEGAKVGQFEFKDMAGELPALTAAAAQLGMVGERALAQLVAGLEIARTATGDSATAANDMLNLFGKITAKETIDRFAKLGINLEKEIKKGVQKGSTALETFLELVMRLTKGDPFKMKDLIVDAQAGRALSALIGKYEQFGDTTQRVFSASGARAKAFENVMGDAMAPVERMEAGFDRIVKAAGQLVAIPLGPTFEAIGAVLENLAELAQNPDANKKAEESWGRYKQGMARRKEERSLNGSIAVAEADLARAEASEKTGNPLSRGRGRQAREQLSQLYARREYDRLAYEAANIPWPGSPADIPIDAAAGRSSFHYRRVQGLQPRAIPRPLPDPRRGAAPSFPPVQGFDLGSSAGGPAEVTARLEGKADVGVIVEVRPSPQFDAHVRSLVRQESGNVRINTGVSLPETRGRASEP